MYQPNQNFLPFTGQYPPSLLQGLILQQQNNNLSNNNKPPPLMNQQHRIPLMNQPPSLLTLPTPLIQPNYQPNLSVPLIGGSFNHKSNFGPMPLMSSLQPPLLLLQQQHQQPISLLDLNPVPSLKNNLDDEEIDHQNYSSKYKIYRYDLDSVERLIEQYEHELINDNDDLQIELQTTDYNHGLSASSFSTKNLDNGVKIEKKQSKTPPPSLLSLKVGVAFSSNESSIKKSSSSNLFPILTESNHETTYQKSIPVSIFLNKY
jgi:hypothetical protein